MDKSSYNSKDLNWNEVEMTRLPTEQLCPHEEQSVQSPSAFLQLKLCFIIQSQGIHRR